MPAWFVAGLAGGGGTEADGNEIMTLIFYDTSLVLVSIYPMFRFDALTLSRIQHLQGNNIINTHFLGIRDVNRLS